MSKCEHIIQINKNKNPNKNCNLVKVAAIYSRGYGKGPSLVNVTRLQLQQVAISLYMRHLKSIWNFSNSVCPINYSNLLFSWGTISVIYWLWKTVFTIVQSKIYFKIQHYLLNEKALSCHSSALLLCPPAVQMGKKRVGLGIVRFCF